PTPNPYPLSLHDALPTSAPAGAAPGAAPAPQPQSAAAEERTMEIWSTPQGFLKAALANNATSRPAGAGSEITFTAGKNKYVGTRSEEHTSELQSRDHLVC